MRINWAHFSFLEKCTNAQNLTRFALSFSIRKFDIRLLRKALLTVYVLIKLFKNI